MENPDSIIFDEDQPESAQEYLRLVLDLLQKKNLAPNMVNYDLFYAYVSGKNQTLNQKIDEFLEGQKNWTHDEAKKLFYRFLYEHTEILVEDIRVELTKTIAALLGSVTELGGLTALTSTSLSSRIEELSKTNKPNEILAITNDILSDTKELFLETRNFEVQLNDTNDDLHKLKSELADAKKVAVTDALTGLSNRHGLVEYFDKLMQDRRQQKSHCSLILMDIDHFKDINDQFGHLLGDKVLSSIAGILRQSVRNEDFCARFGGEEFIVILPDCNSNKATVIAEKIRKTIKGFGLKNTKSGNTIENFSASFGVTGFKEYDTLESAIERSDRALYQAKSSGRDKVITL
jgi:diguanylate cyclase